MILFQMPLNLETINFGSIFDTVMVWVWVLVAFVAIGLLIFFLLQMINYNIEAELIYPVGEAFINEDGKKLINFESDKKPARLYKKKTGGGGSIEYFKIGGTNWNYQNYFKPESFYFRKKGLFDFKTKGIKLFVSQEKGLVPLLMSNPGFIHAGTTLNEVIGAISDSLHEREMLYRNDFWSKYGQIITISFLIGFLVIGMLFIIKYQDVFWQNSMSALQSTINAVKETASPVLK